MVFAAYNSQRYGKEEKQIESFRWEEEGGCQENRANGNDGCREPESPPPLRNTRFSRVRHDDDGQRSQIDA